METLDDQRISLIPIARTQPRTAYFVSGLASRAASRLHITYDPKLVDIDPLGTPRAWRAVDPEITDPFFGLAGNDETGRFS